MTLRSKEFIRKSDASIGMKKAQIIATRTLTTIRSIPILPEESKNQK